MPPATLVRTLLADFKLSPLAKCLKTQLSVLASQRDQIRLLRQNLISIFLSPLDFP